MEKFYDHCSLSWLLDAATEMGFPPEALVVGTEAALGNRAITLSGATLPTGVAATGLLAGDLAATSFTKALLMPLCFRV